MSTTNTLPAKKFDTKRMVQLAILIAVLIVLDITGIGLVKIPPVSITTMHIPVIVGAIILGPSAGAVLGGTFGIISVLEATFRATSPVDIAFSPFLSGHPIASLLMSIGTRILLGVAAGYLFKWISQLDKTNILASTVSAALATLVHSAGVLGCLWLLFPNLSLAFKDILMVILSLNFLLEVAAAVLFALAFSKVIPAIRKITGRT